MSALLLIPAAFVSCSDDDTEGGSPYFRLENTVVSSKLVTASSDLGFDAEAIIGDATLELIRYPSFFMDIPLEEQLPFSEAHELNITDESLYPIRS